MNQISLPLPDGFLAIDKPVGISSFQALSPTKKLHRRKKVGHAGTLDPAASGLLLVGVGRGTRLLEFLEALEKTYEFTLKLGVVTDTYDGDGKVLEEKDATSITESMIEELLSTFRGKIKQRPPAYSAIKIGGERAYDLARDGKEVIIPEREVEVKEFTLLSFSTGSARMRLRCSKGTYVRSLAHDIGKLLGCGAISTDIRRTAIGTWPIEKSCAHDDNEALKKPWPLEEALSHLAIAHVQGGAEGAIFHGNTIYRAQYRIEGTAEAGNTVRIFSGSGQLMAMGTLLENGALKPLKVLIGD